MTLNLSEDDYVCSVLRLSGFGEKTEDIWDNPPVATSYKDFKTALRQAASQFEKHNCNVGYYSAVFATALSTQPKALRFLRQMRFQELTVPKYDKYPEHGISHFMISAERFCKLLDLKPPKSTPTAE